MKKLPKWVPIAVPFILIFLAIGYSNNQDQKKYFANPEVGDYYVFENLLSEKGRNREQVLKINSIQSDSIEFLIPYMQMNFGTIDQDDISDIKSYDKEGEVYGTESLKISTNDLVIYYDNGALLKVLTEDPDIIKVIRIYK